MSPVDGTRARLPDDQGYVERDGVRVFYEVYGHGTPAVLFLPTWSFVHSRVWRAQLPYFGRHFRAITFDGRGNGRSDRPPGVSPYRIREFTADALAVMDRTATESAVVVGFSLGAQYALALANDHPDRVAALLLDAPAYPLSFASLHLIIPAVAADWRLPRIGWLRQTRRNMERDYEGFADWFIRKCLPEPHSTRAIELGLAYAAQTDGRTVAAAAGAALADFGRNPLLRRRRMHQRASGVRCPVRVVCGDSDKVTPIQDARLLAKHTGGDLVTVEGAGHLPHGRHPVRFNLALRDFTERVARERESKPAAARRRLLAPITGGSGTGRRALFVSSPIGLGHAQRDVAIARELRRLVPDLEVDWLAQDPVTRVLEREGERIHPASRHLASESGHFESESAEHDLHCFHTWRRMDEILIANFMVFQDVVTDDRYDLWIADEGWEIDYYLHENPQLKNAGYAWLTDFVGVLPMPGADGYERYLAGDYNAQMIEHIAAHPGLRDRSIFVGDPEDVVPERFGPGLPTIRDWTERHFDFAGYITGFDPLELGDRDALREDLGYRPGEKVCVVSVGGSGIGESLLRRVIDAFPPARERVPELRMVVVAGPRIDPSSLPAGDGLEVRAYVHNLYRHLAACDLAVVQGGLTTAMELTANRRPFIYFPLKHHFEQRIHVAHRLDRYGAGRRMEYDDAPPEVIAGAIVEELGREVDYRPVETDGARRAAERLADML